MEKQNKEMSLSDKIETPICKEHAELGDLWVYDVREAVKKLKESNKSCGCCEVCKDRMNMDIDRVFGEKLI